MERLDRSFHLRGIVLIPWFMAVVGLITGSAWLAMPPAGPRVLSTFVFYLGVACLLATPHLFLYRLHLQTTAEAFVISIRFMSATVYQRETPGISWRPVAGQGVPVDGESDFCRHRVEVLQEDGSRRVVLGTILSFAFGVECL